MFLEVIMKHTRRHFLLEVFLFMAVTGTFFSTQAMESESEPEIFQSASDQADQQNASMLKKRNSDRKKQPRAKKSKLQEDSASEEIPSSNASRTSATDSLNKAVAKYTNKMKTLVENHSLIPLEKFAQEINALKGDVEAIIIARNNIQNNVPIVQANFEENLKTLTNLSNYLINHENNETLAPLTSMSFSNWWTTLIGFINLEKAKNSLAQKNASLRNRMPSLTRYATIAAGGALVWHIASSYFLGS